MILTPYDGALLAQRAYIDTPTIGVSTSASRMHVYTLSDGTTVHAFRGTDDVQSFFADANISLTNVAGLGLVHTGFYAALATILPAALALPRPAYIVGHSLGAAMAILYAATLALHGPAVPVFAYEPPRLAGDGTLAQLISTHAIPWFACRNGRDLITQVPPELTLPGPLTAIGQSAFVFDNIVDHAIERVAEALKAA